MPDIITSEKMDDFEDILVAVSTRKFGNQSFQHPKVSEKETILNRKRFFSSAGINANYIVGAGLCHSNTVYNARNTDQGKGSLDKNSLIPNCDGLVTDCKKVFLMLTIADCFPVFVYDPNRKVIGLAHAGWRGVRKNILSKTISMVSGHSIKNAGSLMVYVGPGIHSCHFQVKSDVAKEFKNTFGSGVVIMRDGSKFIDLTLAIKHQLLLAGVLEDNIEISNYCTACNELLFSSFRRDKNDYITQGAVIGMI